MQEKKTPKSEYDLIVGRRIQETIDILRMSEDPLIKSIVRSIKNVDWKEINAILPTLKRDEVYLLGKLSGLVRVGHDVHSLSQVPIIITRSGEVVQNPHKLPIRIVDTYQEGLLYSTMEKGESL